MIGDYIIEVDQKTKQLIDTKDLREYAVIHLPDGGFIYKRHILSVIPIEDTEIKEPGVPVVEETEEDRAERKEELQGKDPGVPKTGADFSEETQQNCPHIEWVLRFADTEKGRRYRRQCTLCGKMSTYVSEENVRKELKDKFKDIKPLKR